MTGVVISPAPAGSDVLIVPGGGSGAPGPTGPPGTGSTIGVKDEGSALGTTFQYLNFRGANVTASASGTEAEIDVTGSSGGLSGLLVNPVADYGVVAGTGHGAANDTAMLAMFADLRTKATNVNSIYQGTIPIRFPAGYFEFSSTIELIDGTFIIEGATAAGPGGLGTVLKFPSGVTGIRVQRYNTSGASSTRTAARGADASIVRNLALLGAYSSTEAEAHGIHLRASAHVEDVYIANFEGDGIYSHVSAGSGGASEGNANNCRFYNLHIQGCRNGLNIDGADVNIWAVLSCFFASNRQWGVWDSSFLGNSYFACQAEGNGIVTGQLSVVHSGSNYYTVVRGQETGASTNAPSGTTADNTWWYFMGVGGGGYPAWTSGNTYRAGGSFLTDDTGNANNLFSGCYHEGGQPWAQIVGPALVSGGSMRPSVKGVACLYGAGGGFGSLGWIGSSGGLLAAGNLQVFGSSHQIGPETGTAADNLLQLYNTNVTSAINGISTSGNIGNINFNYGSGITYDVWNVSWTHRLRINGVSTFTISGSGAGYDTGVGGTVTQATSKATGVTLNKVCGAITLNSAALAATAVVSFTLTDSAIAADDFVDVWVKSGNATAGTYRCWSEGNGAGGRIICVQNISGGSLSEALVLGFGVNKRSIS